MVGGEMGCMMEGFCKRGGYEWLRVVLVELRLIERFDYHPVFCLTRARAPLGGRRTTIQSIRVVAAERENQVKMYLHHTTTLVSTSNL